MLSGICCAAITSIEMANAKAASMKVSSRVISIPRKRNPRSRGNESRSAGNADAMSRWRSFICRKSYATQCHVCKDFLTFPKLPRECAETLTSPRLLDRVDNVGTNLLVALQLQQPTLLRFEEQFVESMEPMRTLVETGVLTFHRLLHE